MNASAASRRGFLTGALAGLASFAGCIPRVGKGPFVVSTWAEEELAALGLERPYRILRPPGSQSPIDLAIQDVGADLVVGGPVADYARVAASQGFLETAAGAYQVASRGPAALIRIHDASKSTEPSAGWAALGSAEWSGRLIVADPRRDAFLRSMVLTHLHANPFAAAYGDLALAFGRAAMVTPSVRAGIAVAESRGWSACAVLGPTALGEALGRSAQPFSSAAADYHEGIGVLAGSRYPEIVHTLRGLSGPSAIPSSDREEDRGSDLLILLIGAVFVEPHRELREAVRALDDVGEVDNAAVDRARGWLSEPPPWPPASVTKLQSRPGSQRLLAQLAGLIADTRANEEVFLDALDLSPGLIDAELLARLASMNGGRLVGAPRFLAWLQAEWTAWAAQRYRRVARLARQGSAPGHGAPAA